MSKSMFTLSERKSAKYIIKANANNPLLLDNTVVIHAYPNKTGFKCYLHEKALTLATKSMTVNERYKKKLENPDAYKSEHFARVFSVTVNRANCKTPKDIEKTDLNAINALITELDERANAIIERENTKKESANADKKESASKKANADKKANAKTDKSAKKESAKNA